MTPVLTVEGVSKQYGVIRALSDVSLSLHPGEVLGVLGDNGAGKSTLVSILSGVMPPTRGQVTFEGAPVSIRSPRDAKALGIETVYQDLALAPDLTVWQNVFLGSEQTQAGWLKSIGWLDRKAMAAAVSTAVVDTGIKLASVESLCGRLSGGQRQTTAITSAFTWATKVLLLDEPTSALGPHERSRVNALIKDAAERGLAVLLVTQDLGQMEEVCNRSVILRHGRIVAEVARGTRSTTDLIGYITGAHQQAPNGDSLGPPAPDAEAPSDGGDLAPARPRPKSAPTSALLAGNGHAPAVSASAEPMLVVEGVSKHYGPVTALSKVDIELYPGEVLGLVGHNGAGKSTLVGILSGTIRPTEGRVLLDGEELEIRSPIDSQSAGIETVYQDLALAPELSGWQNVFLGHEQTSPGILGRMGWLDRRAMAAATNEGIAQTGIGVSSIETRCAELSGGQRQALAIVRARMRGRKVVLFDEPTSALGIEEQERVNALLRSLADRGMAVLLISHNLPKAHEICDRIAVLKMGRLVAEVEPSTCSLDELVQHVVG